LRTLAFLSLATRRLMCSMSLSSRLAPFKFTPISSQGFLYEQPFQSTVDFYQSHLVVRYGRIKRLRPGWKKKKNLD
jgi:hypothetical protein